MSKDKTIPHGAGAGAHSGRGGPKPLRSFADLAEVEIVTKKPDFSMWDSGAMTVNVLSEVTNQLTAWLDARFRDLIRERVNEEDIHVAHRGGRTIIYANGVPRFEFKVKVTYGNA